MSSKPAVVPVTTGARAPRSREVRMGTLVFGSFPPLLRLPSHVHERACLTVVLGGRFCERFARLEADCDRGTVLAKPGGEGHDDLFSRDGSEQVIFEPFDLRSELMAPCASFFEEIRHARDSAAEHVARRLSIELEQDDDASELAVEGLLLELLATTVRGAERRGGAGAPPRWLRRARELLHDGATERLDAVELAAAVGVHPAYLARMFRMHFGTSVGEYERRLRLERAAGELVRTEDPISAIAVRNGFSDQSHFTRLFKRYAGVTPLQHRQRAVGARD